MSVRIRGPKGHATIALSPGMSIAAFQAAVAEATGVPVEAQELRGGFPPRPLALPDGDCSSVELASLGIAAGDNITVTQAAGLVAARGPPAAAAAPETAAAPAPQQHALPPAAAAAFGGGMSEDEQLARAIAASLGQDLPAAPDSAAGSAAAAGPQMMSEDEQLARAIAASLGQDVTPPAAASTAAPAAPRPAPTAAAGGGSGGSAEWAAAGASATWAPLPDDSVRGVVRRKMEDDNSCMFSAVGYVTSRDRRRASALRGVIAEAVLSDPVEWNEAVLQKEPAAYAEWIRRPSSWGGAIELSILSRRLGVEIAAFDIQTMRADVYGQNEGHAKRCLLIYDGLHYDALAVAASRGAPENLDAVSVPSSGPACEAAMAAAAALVAQAHAARQFTDTANFTLRCSVCRQGLKGEREAVAHAQATGHTDFSEYH